MKGNIDGFSPIEDHGGEILVEERFEHDDFVPMIQKSGENGILALKGHEPR